ncbi:hypothetical protein NUW58_g6874 [Xylaria curta]|uniref:Uncharacterized protein n=1 Tax=Xylaria curta TaxID=42375 RepID=A0ACC1NNN8_9PEZI|nr:hypothetical protein NUW58_g6874 [Xylaria curta]
MIRSKYNDVGRNVGQQQSGLPSDLHTKGNSGVIKTKQENNKAGALNSYIDPELHRLITEWREKKTRDDYQPYSEEELREFGELWKVGVLSRQPEYLRTKEEIHEGLKELEELYTTLIRVSDNFYELAWIRRSPDFWDHIWLTFHLAGATVEEVWEIVHHKWPKLLEEGKFFGLHEIEKLREFIGSSNTILLQCDYLLGEFEFKRERQSLSALPNFWLSYMKLDSYGLDNRHQAGGVFSTPAGDPDWQCDDATYDSGIWSNKDDVSGDKYGMRCDPSDDVGFPLYRDPLEVVEFNTGKFWAGHQTIYSDRDYGLYDMDGHKTAQCYGEQVPSPI